METTRNRLVVIGAGGFAQEVRWLIDEAISAKTSPWEFAGYLVSDLDRVSEGDAEEEILGDLSWLDTNADSVGGVAIGIGTPGPRVSLGVEISARYPALEWPSLIHPSVTLDWRSSSIGRGVIICANTVGTVDLVLGDYSMVNLACTLGHGSKLGKGCVLNPTVNVSGGVELGDEVLVGTGAQLLQYVSVGHNAVVGAGAVVTKDVDPHATVVGVPAKPLSDG